MEAKLWSRRSGLSASIIIPSDALAEEVRLPVCVSSDGFCCFPFGVRGRLSVHRTEAVFTQYPPKLLLRMYMEDPCRLESSSRGTCEMQSKPREVRAVIKSDAIVNSSSDSGLSSE